VAPLRAPRVLDQEADVVVAGDEERVAALWTGDRSMTQVDPPRIRLAFGVRQPSWIAAETAMAPSSVIADCMSSIAGRSPCSTRRAVVLRHFRDELRIVKVVVLDLCRPRLRAADAV